MPVLWSLPRDLHLRLAVPPFKDLVDVLLFDLLQLFFGLRFHIFLVPLLLLDVLLFRPRITVVDQRLVFVIQRLLPLVLDCDADLRIGLRVADRALAQPGCEYLIALRCLIHLHSGLGDLEQILYMDLLLLDLFVVHDVEDSVNLARLLKVAEGLSVHLHGIRDLLGGPVLRVFFLLPARVLPRLCGLRNLLALGQLRDGSVLLALSSARLRELVGICQGFDHAVGLSSLGILAHRFFLGSGLVEGRLLHDAVVVNELLADVFTLGMVTLFMTSMRDSDQIYRVSEGRIDFHLID